MDKKFIYLFLSVLCTLNFARAGNNARFIGQSVPTEVFVGQQFTVSLTFRNNGTTTWRPGGANPHWLGSENPRDNFTWGTNRGGKVNRRVAPRENYTFTFTVTAPPTPGNYNFQWMMLQNGIEWFGQKSANVVINVKPENKVNNSRFISQSVQSTAYVGEQFTVSLTFKNNGTTAWKPGGVDSHWLGSENPRDNFRWGTNRGGRVSRIVAPGENYTFTFAVTAPSTSGNYSFQWMMLQNGVEWFGQKSENIIINVKEVPQNKARFIGQVVPAEVFAGDPFSVSLTFENNGTITWKPGGAKFHVLGSVNPRDNDRWGTNRGPRVSTRIAPGERNTFNFVATAPASPGNYNFQWRMLQEGVEWFGQKSLNVVINVKPRPEFNSARFVSWTVPSVVFVGEKFPISITMENNGTKIWLSSGNSHWLGSENPRDNTTWGTNRGGKVTTNIDPGQQFTFNFELTAPSIPGTYDFQWMMLQPTFGWFPEKTPNKRIAVKTLPSDIIGKAMFGYQGWFTTDKDGANLNHSYNHYYLNGDSSKPLVDYWPDISEYTKLYDSGLDLPDGSTASLYSAYDQSSVALHMRWLKDYGLDGVFLQRFTGELDGGSYEAFRDTVMQNVQSGCEAHGRYFGMMYDISTDKPADQLEVIKTDWNKIKSVATSDNYITYKGKPLLAIWGIGYDRDNYTYNPNDVINFIRDMKSTYNLTILIGVPGCWKDGCDDAYSYSQWENVYKEADIIMPWRVGGFKGTSYQNVYDVYKADVDKINTFPDSEFMPVIFPGFSWKNLKTFVPNNTPGPADEVYNWIGRKGGEFYWKLSYNAIEAGSKMVYIAMFDEIDEGTAMFKLAANELDVPRKDSFEGDTRILYLNYGNIYDLPSDWYLRCAQKTGQVLREEIVNTSQLPLVIPLKPTELNGEAKYLKNCIEIHPNPANISFEINMEEFNKPLEISIYDLNGVKRLNKKYNGEPKSLIDISGLKQGVYILHINTDKEIYSKKLFVH